MNPQESQVLQDFLNQLIQVNGIQKDPQAEAMIARAVSQQPDAAYLLVQRALLLDQALNAAKSQIASLQNQLQSAQTPSRGFLDANTWGNSPASAAPSRASAAPVAPAAASAPSQYPYQAAPAAAASAPGFLGGGMGSILGSVAATAAGVAGGAFLFQGIEHLMNHNSGSGLGSHFFGQQGVSSVEPVEQTTINNYYGDSSASDDRSDDNDNDLFADSGIDDDSNDDDSLI